MTVTESTELPHALPPLLSRAKGELRALLLGPQAIGKSGPIFYTCKKVIHQSHLIHWLDLGYCMLAATSLSKDLGATSDLSLHLNPKSHSITHAH